MSFDLDYLADIARKSGPIHAFAAVESLYRRMVWGARCPRTGKRVPANSEMDRIDALCARFHYQQKAKPHLRCGDLIETPWGTVARGYGGIPTLHQDQRERVES